jgi:hypothetical protein
MEIKDEKLENDGYSGRPVRVLASHCRDACLENI